jgi:hypothetical protein
MLVTLGLGAITSLSFANALLPSPPSTAQTTTIPQPSEAPLELSLLQPSANENNNVVTSNTIYEQGLTVPSLWWAKEQFGNNLLGEWIAYPVDGNTPGRVDLVVDRQNWSLLDYIERYEFVNSFGTVARDYGYNVRVFNYQKQLLATYTCDFAATPHQCNIKLDSAGINNKS